MKMTNIFIHFELYTTAMSSYIAFLCNVLTSSTWFMVILGFILAGGLVYYLEQKIQKRHIIYTNYLARQDKKRIILALQDMKRIIFLLQDMKLIILARFLINQNINSITVSITVREKPENPWLYAEVDPQTLTQINRIAHVTLQEKGIGPLGEKPVIGVKYEGTEVWPQPEKKTDIWNVWLGQGHTAYDINANPNQVSDAIETGKLCNNWHLRELDYPDAQKELFSRHVDAFKKGHIDPQFLEDDYLGQELWGDEEDYAYDDDDDNQEYDIHDDDDNQEHDIHDDDNQEYDIHDDDDTND